MSTKGIITALARVKIGLNWNNCDLLVAQNGMEISWVRTGGDRVGEEESLPAALLQPASMTHNCFYGGLASSLSSSSGKKPPSSRVVLM
jgi:hypothetical protein